MNKKIYNKNGYELSKEPLSYELRTKDSVVVYFNFVHEYGTHFNFFVGNREAHEHMVTGYAEKNNMPDELVEELSKLKPKLDNT